MQIIREFFERLTEAKLTINLAKSEFAQAQVTFLGHVVGQGKVKPVDDKIGAISEFQRPENKKQLMRFPNLSAVTELLTQLLNKREKFMWCDTSKSISRTKSVT